MRPRPARTEVWPAPVRGLLRSGALVGAPRDAAEELVNFLCTDSGIRLRGGASKTATIDGPVEALMVYQSGSAQQFWAASEAEIFDVTAPVDPDTSPAPTVTGLTSGDWSYTQFGTSGGQFMVAVNGSDDLHLYDGSAWTAVDAVSVPAITGIGTDKFTFVWSHKRRLWFCERDYPSAWYLPINSIGGAAVEFPLDSVFQLGGGLMFGGTWSRDSGSGMDDLQVFVSTEGEVAIYQGVDPSTADSWSLVGVYRIGRPLHKNAHFRAGGDLLVLTEDGVIAVSAAMQVDRLAQQAMAVTAPIGDLWRDTITARQISSRFPTIIWPSRRLLLIGVPSTTGIPSALASNSTTGGWSRVTGWDIRALALFQDRVYFGDAQGRIARADSGGSDMGQPFSAVCVPKMQDFGTPADKVMLHARATWRSNVDLAVALQGVTNYSLVGIEPATVNEGDEDVTKWGGGGKWGSGLKWGSPQSKFAGTSWQAVWGSGFAVAPALSISVGRGTPASFDLASLHLQFEIARAI